MIRRSLLVMLAGGAALMLPGCVPTEMSGNKGNAETSIYYRSQAEADAALAAFDRDNPQCKLWTNWQKMCSRTGPNREPHCVVERGSSIAPSLPFCAVASGDWNIVEFRTKGENASAMRFCKGEFYGSLRLRCSAPAEGRPFDGHAISSRRHPYCTVWAEEHTGTPVCAEGNAFRELPRCSGIEESTPRAKNALYCAHEAQSINEQCSSPGGLSSDRAGYWMPGYPYIDENRPTTILGIQQEPYISSIYCESK